MIEKLARYLCECDEVNPDATLSGDGVNFLWESYAVRVKEMLKIMRDYNPSADDAQSWKNMIDAILGT